MFYRRVDSKLRRKKSSMSENHLFLLVFIVSNSTGDFEQNLQKDLCDEKSLIDGKN